MLRKTMLGMLVCVSVLTATLAGGASQARSVSNSSRGGADGRIMSRLREGCATALCSGVSLGPLTDIEAVPVIGAM